MNCKNCSNFDSCGEMRCIINQVTCKCDKYRKKEEVKCKECKSLYVCMYSNFILNKNKDCASFIPLHEEQQTEREHKPMSYFADKIKSKILNMKCNYCELNNICEGLRMKHMNEDYNCKLFKLQRPTKQELTGIFSHLNHKSKKENMKTQSVSENELFLIISKTNSLELCNLLSKYAYENKKFAYKIDVDNSFLENAYKIAEVEDKKLGYAYNKNILDLIFKKPKTNPRLDAMNEWLKRHNSTGHCETKVGDTVFGVKGIISQIGIGHCVSLISGCSAHSNSENYYIVISPIDKCDNLGAGVGKDVIIQF